MIILKLSISHALILNKYIYLLLIKIMFMRSTYFVITRDLLLHVSPASGNKANNYYMKQAQSSLEQKDFTKARYLFCKHKAFSNEGDYTHTSHRLRNKSDVPVLAKTIIRKHSSFAGK